MTSNSTTALIIGLNYFPEQTGNAPYTTGLAEGLRRRGMMSRVITGYPHYPEWKRHAGYNGWSIDETIGNVPIRRLKHFIPSKPRGLARLGMELSFGLRVLFCAWHSPDVILLVSPALFSTGLALLRARISRREVPVVIWVQDLYSLGMTQTGQSGSRGAEVMRRFESHCLRSADGVVVIHERFKSYVTSQLGVEPSKVEVIRNWTHLTPLVLKDRQTARSSFGWETDDFVVLHAGNMGAKQGLENVVDAARMAERKGSRIRFVLMGDGNQRLRLEKLGQDIGNLTFMESQPGPRFQEALAAADVLLVNELPEVKDMSVPSKLTSYFSSGVPVVAATAANSVTAEEIEVAQAGVLADAGNPQALLDAVEFIQSNVAASRQLAANGLRFMKNVLSEDQALSQYNRYLTQLAAVATASAN